jgi:hypothetical protein
LLSLEIFPDRPDSSPLVIGRLMAGKYAPYGRRYKKERLRLLASKPPCCERGCKNPATTTDHFPPLMRHTRPHRSGSGCCVLRAMCVEHMRIQGGQLATHKRKGGRPPPLLVVEADPDGFDVDHPVWDRASWLDDLREVPADGWWPRLMTIPHPDAVGTLGDEVTKWAKAEYGISLHWCQRLFNARLLEVDDQGDLVWPRAMLSESRQSGKSTDVRMLCDWRMHQADRFGEAQVIMHTADTLQHAEDLQALCYLRAEERGERVRRAAGSVGIYLPDGQGSWMVRSGPGVVGSSVSLGVADEAHGVKVRTITQNLEPTLVERANAQLLLVSTAHTECTELMPMYRVDGLQQLGEPNDLLMLEWSASADLGIGDMVAWRQASPHWSKRREQRISSAAVQALALPEHHEVRYGFGCQYLNRWPVSDSRQPGERLLLPGAWTRCIGHVPAAGPGWCAIEDNRGTGAAAAFVAVGASGVLEVDGLALDSWEQALVWARKFVDAAPGSRVVVGASMRDAVPRDFPGRAQLRRAGSSETRKALSLLRSLVAEGKVVHEDRPDLARQVDDARVRPVDGGLGLITGPRSDLLRAALWALWFAQKPPAAPRVA